MKSNKITVKLDNIFSANVDAFVIPRSTIGTMSDNFTRGLRDELGVSSMSQLPYRTLGSLDIEQHISQLKIRNGKKNFHVLYATCVDNNTSNYEAIKDIAKDIAKFSANNPTIRDIATPLLGTGAGGLDHAEVFQILYETFDEIANPSCHLFVYIQEELIYQRITNYTKWEQSFENSASHQNEIDSILSKFKGKFFLAGAYWGRDVSQEFFNEQKWENGYDGEYGDVVNEASPGDIIFLKSTFAEGGVGYLRIKGIGRVRRNFRNGIRLDVDWKISNVQFDLDDLSHYRYTISLIDEYVAKIILEAIGAEIILQNRVFQETHTISDIVQGLLKYKLDREKLKANSIKAKLHSDLFAQEDLLNYQLYAESIAQFIKSKSTSPPLTIGILAPWGKGKTTLMKFIQKKLDNYSSNDADDQIATTYKWLKEWTKKADLASQINLRKLKNPTVWFNAWKFQKTEEVWAGFAYEIIHQLVSKLPSKLEKEKFWLLLNLKRIDKRIIIQKINFEIINKVIKSAVFIIGLIIFLVPLILSIVFNWSYGIDFISVPGLILCLDRIQRIKKKKLDFDISKYVKQPEYENKMGYFHTVESDLKMVLNLLISKDDPVVIFIDDLDRCSPKMVAEVIEAINLFISGDFPDCYFILGQDAQMVAAALDSAYKDMGSKVANIEKGHGSLGWYFMEKFIQLNFTIPNISETQSKRYLKELLGETLINHTSTKKDEAENVLDEIAIEISKASTNKELKDITSKIDIDSKRLTSQAEHRKLISVQEQIIDKAAEIFEDNDSEFVEIIETYSKYVGNSPRMIKRFVNLYRFYRFMQFASSDKKLIDIDADSIGRWIVVIIRWPQLVRCIQWDTEKNFLNGSTPIERANYFESEINKSAEFTLWQEFINKSYQDEMPWLEDRSLYDFIKNTGNANNKLGRAIEAGFW
jgi:hypothetical protein